MIISVSSASIQTTFEDESDASLRLSNVFPPLQAMVAFLRARLIIFEDVTSSVL
jgi:hypothetical protein